MSIALLVILFNKFIVCLFSDEANQAGPDGLSPPHQWQQRPPRPTVLRVEWERHCQTQWCTMFWSWWPLDLATEFWVSILCLTRPKSNTMIYLFLWNSNVRLMYNKSWKIEQDWSVCCEWNTTLWSFSSGYICANEPYKNIDSQDLLCNKRVSILIFLS